MWMFKCAAGGKIEMYNIYPCTLEIALFTMYQKNTAMFVSLPCNSKGITESLLLGNCGGNISKK